MQFLPREVFFRQEWIVLSTRVSSVYRAALTVLLLLLLLVASPCLSSAGSIILVVLLISSHCVSLSFHYSSSLGMTLGTDSIFFPTFSIIYVHRGAESIGLP